MSTYPAPPPKVTIHRTPVPVHRGILRRAAGRVRQIVAAPPGLRKNKVGSGARRRFLQALASGLIGAALLPGASARGESVGLRLMPLGDSITRGFRSSTNDGYRGPLYSALKKRGIALDFVGSQRAGSMFDPDNEGYNGYRIDQIADLIGNAMAVCHPNVVTLHIGSNDIGQNHQVPTAPQRLASLIDQILASDPRVTILVAQLVCNATPATQALTDSYNDKIPEIVQSRARAGKHVYLVSMKALTKEDLADGLHPNDAGYQKMADAWDAALQHVIADHWVAPIEFAGVFEIQNLESGLTLDVSDGSTANGAKVVQRPSHNDSNQRWTFIPSSGGYYQIKNARSGLDLNVSGASKQSEAKIVQWSFGTEGNDEWLPTRQADGTYTFSNRNSKLVLDIPGGSTQGTQLDQANGNGRPNQKFKLLPK